MNILLEMQATDLVLEYKNHFYETLRKHGGRCPVSNTFSLKLVKDKSAFFKDLKHTWALKKKNK